MTDLAELSIKITTDAGDSAQQLDDVQKKTDSLAQSTSALSDAHDNAGRSASSFAGNVASTGDAMARSAAEVDNLVNPLQSTASAFDQVGQAADTQQERLQRFIDESIKAQEANKGLAESHGEVSGSMLTFDMHLTHLVHSLETGHLNLRAMTGVLRDLGKAMDETTASTSLIGSRVSGMADAVGLSIPQFVAMGAASVALSAALVMTITHMGDMEKAVDNMSKGVASGMGVTGEAFTKEVLAASSASELTVAAAGDIGKEFIKTGQVGTENLGRLIENTQKWADITGQTVKQAGAEMAKAFEDPAKGIDTLNEKLSMGDDEFTRYIKFLADTGETAQASSELQARWNDRVEEAKKSMTGFEVAIQNFQHPIDMLTKNWDALVVKLMNGAKWWVEVGEGILAAGATVVGVTGKFETVQQIFDKYPRTLAGAAQAFKELGEQVLGWETASQKARAEQEKISQEAGKVADSLIPEGKAIIDIVGNFNKLDAEQKAGLNTSKLHQQALAEATQKMDQLVKSMGMTIPEFLKLSDKEKQAAVDSAILTDHQIKLAQSLNQTGNAAQQTGDKVEKSFSAAAAASKALQSARESYLATEYRVNSGIQAQIDAYKAEESALASNSKATAQNTGAVNDNTKAVSEATKASDSLRAAKEALQAAEDPLISSTKAEASAISALASSEQKYKDTLYAVNSGLKDQQSAFDTASKYVSIHQTNVDKLRDAWYKLAEAQDYVDSGIKQQVDALNEQTKATLDTTKAVQQLSTLETAEAEQLRVANAERQNSIDWEKQQSDASKQLQDDLKKEADLQAQNADAFKRKADEENAARQSKLAYIDAEDKAFDSTNKLTGSLKDQIGALNQDAQAANTDADAIDAMTIAQNNAASSSGSSNQGYAISASATHPDVMTNKAVSGSGSGIDLFGGPISALQSQMADLTKVIDDANKMKAPTLTAQPPAPPDVSAGATSSRAPGAYGGDKNADFFYDPNSRESFLAQFGIIGNAETQRAERQYQLQVQQYQQAVDQYHAELDAYNKAQQAAAAAQAQLQQINAQLQMLLMLQALFGGGAKGAAGGGDFMVNGAAGIDTNLVQLRLTAGELISVRTPEQQKAANENTGGNVINLVINTPDVQNFKRSRSQIVTQVASMMSQATKNRGG